MMNLKKRLQISYTIQKHTQKKEDFVKIMSFSSSVTTLPYYVLICNVSLIFTYRDFPLMSGFSNTLLCFWGMFLDLTLFYNYKNDFDSHQLLLSFTLKSIDMRKYAFLFHI